MCRQISARIIIVSGRRDERERYYARPTAWATQRANTARRRWKAGSSNGRTTWKVISGDGSSCQTAFCHITGSFLRVIGSTASRDAPSTCVTRPYVRLACRRNARAIKARSIIHVRRIDIACYQGCGPRGIRCRFSQPRTRGEKKKILGIRRANAIWGCSLFVRLGYVRVDTILSIVPDQK